MSSPKSRSRADTTNATSVGSRLNSPAAPLTALQAGSASKPTRRAVANTACALPLRQSTTCVAHDEVNKPEFDSFGSCWYLFEGVLTQTTAVLSDHNRQLHIA